jgi:hypothetical protein
MMVTLRRLDMNRGKVMMMMMMMKMPSTVVPAMWARKRV